MLKSTKYPASFRRDTTYEIRKKKKDPHQNQSTSYLKSQTLTKLENNL